MDAAEKIAGILRRAGIDAVTIGAAAMAGYRYVRQTHDIDLGVNADLPQLRVVEQELRKAGYTTELHALGANDPLGGVLDVSVPLGSI